MNTTQFSPATLPVTLPAAIHALYFHRYQVVLEVTRDTHLPQFPADRINLLRGSLNAAMTSTFCKRPNRTGRPCEGCNCTYGQLLSQDWNGQQPYASKYDKPAPFLISLEEAPAPLRKGRELRFFLTLFGDHNKLLPLWIPILNQMAKQCLGRDAGTFALDRILEVDENGYPQQIVYEKGVVLGMQGNCPISFSSYSGLPLTKKKIALDFCPGAMFERKKQATSEVDGELFLSRLLHRISLLASAHCQATYEETDELAIQLAKGLEVDCSGLLSTEWRKRDSGRTQKEGRKLLRKRYTIQQGHLEFSGPALDALAPLLRFGSHVQVGRMTVFGMGRYEIY